MYRFLAAPRWIAAILGFLLLAATMVRLGFWQLDRLHVRQDRNAAISAASTAQPRPAGDYIPADPGSKPDPADEWRKVSVTGTYDASQTILIRQRSFDDGVGFEIVVPLHADDGATYLINRGYVLGGASAADAPPVPAAPSGTVTVVGSVKTPYRADEAATRVEQVGDYRSVRALDATVLSDELGVPLAGGYIAASDEQPASGIAVEEIDRIPLPELDDGPHLSYAVQWWLFAAMTLGGFAYLVRREAVVRLLAEEDLDDEDLDGQDLEAEAPATSGAAPGSSSPPPTR